MVENSSASLNMQDVICVDNNKLKEMLQRVIVESARDKIDACLFLQEHNNDVEKAAAAYSYSQKWKQKFHVDKMNILAVLPAIRRNEVILPGIVDREGHPIFIVRAANHIPDSQPFIETVKLASYLMELAIKSMPPNIHQVVFIEDLTGLKRKNIDPKLVKFLVELLQHYPGRVRAFHSVNAPWYYNMIFSLVKPWLPRELISKVTIHSDLKILFKICTRENILVEHGGSFKFDLNEWIENRMKIEGLKEGDPNPHRIEPSLLVLLQDMSNQPIDVVPVRKKDAKITGWLKKQGGWVRNFNDRYCILTAVGLYYYRAKDDKSAEGVVPIEGCEVRIDTNHPNRFIMTTANKREVIFAASSPKEAEKWKTAIESISALSNTIYPAPQQHENQILTHNNTNQQREEVKMA